MFLIADNFQITNPVIAQAVNDENPAPIKELVRRMAIAGAHAIDINTGPLPKNGESKMAFMIKCVQDVCDLRLCLDTINPKAMEAGLKLAKKRPIINGISLQPHKLEEFIPLARKYDADIVCFLLGPDGHVPKNAAGRLEIASELTQVLAKAEISQKRLIIDPVAVPLMWDDGIKQANEVLETIRLLPEMLGFGVRIMVGISNLTTGRGPREKKLLMERTWLAMLSGSGLSCVLLNVFHTQIMLTAKAASALTTDSIFTWNF